MKLDQKKILKTLNPGRIWLPILIGFGIVALMAWLDPDVNRNTITQLQSIDTGVLLLVFMALLFKEGAYMIRIWHITERQIPLIRSVYVILLWEFASAVTPSVVGGTAVAVFILMMERLSFGRSLAYVVVTAIMDNLFFVLTAPIFLLITGGTVFPKVINAQELLGRSLEAIFYISYGLIALYTSLMAYAVLINPKGFKRLILKITFIRFFRKFRRWSYDQANEIVLAGSKLRNRPFNYWLIIGLLTSVAWIARYSMVNILISGYSIISAAEHVMIFGKHVVLWIVMMLSPTPGSTGTAEYFFKIFYEQYIPNSTVLIAMIWRLASYYPYLIVGALILPRWLREGLTYLNKRNKQKKLIKLRKKQQNSIDQR